jgi:hypothetical protein
MVLLLNLVIALLGSVYSYYKERYQGLYHEVLVDQFAVKEFDYKYGSIVCA